MKRIAICLDGTWQGLDQPNPTNIANLAQSVAFQDAKGASQIVYYSSGVGAGVETQARGKRGLVSGVFGSGLEQHLIDAYRFLAWNYRPGDQIYIFGFSRGAFTARSLGGMIRKCGILSRAKMDLVREAYLLYRGKPTDENKADCAEFRKQHSAAPVFDGTPETAQAAKSQPHIDVAFMGVFDTVGQRGMPAHLGPISQLWNNRYTFHDLNLGAHVRAARHACAVDEDRATFPITPWENLLERNTEAGADPLHADAPFQQRWFAGQHGDVGGGSGSDLANLALRWMVDGAIAALLRFDESIVTPLGIASQPENQDLFAEVTPTKGLVSALGKSPRRILALKPREVASAQDVRRSLHWTTAQRFWSAEKQPPYRPKALKPFTRALEAGRPRG